MSSSALIVDKLGKRYSLNHQRQQDDGLRHVLEEAVRAPLSLFRSKGPWARQAREDFWALRDVSFQIEEGEAVGVIGRNGAGKSTLLKLLSRITEPTLGEIRYRGRVASLLEVGTGFHPELTGRENIYLNAAILGMRRSEIARKFSEIVEFSEVERFLDTPVKRYSSGMYVRLAFSVAAHLDPDILLVDEVLAVGDAAFQQKCFGKMGATVREGRTIVLVSHNMAAISSLCTRALLIEGGRLQASGDPEKVIEEYLARARANAETPLVGRTDRKGDGRVRFEGIEVLNDRNEVVETVTSGQDITFEFRTEIARSETLKNVAIQIKFFSMVGQPLFACSSRTVCKEPLELRPGNRLRCHIPRLPLAPGAYLYSIWCTVGGNLEDHIGDAGTLSVAEGDFFGTGRLPARTVGDFLVAHQWDVV